MQCVVTTTSKLKLAAIATSVSSAHLTGISTADADLPAQPINSGRRCCHERIDFVKRQLTSNSHSGLDIDKKKELAVKVGGEGSGYDYIISIENGIDTIRYFEKGGDQEHFVDICYVVIENRDGVRFEAESYGIPIPIRYVEAARRATSTNYHELGFAVTAGSLIHQHYPHIPADNWMADPLFGGKSRMDQIQNALQLTLDLIRAQP